MHPYVPSVEDAVFRAIRRSGSTALVVPSQTQHPKEFIAVDGEKTTRICVYCWPLSQPPPGTDYRMVIPAGDIKRFDISHVGPTLLIGYEPELDVFVGFDIKQFEKNQVWSGDVQVPWRLLDQAVEHGIAFGVKVGDEFPHPMEYGHKKGKREGEILVAFTPEHFLHFATAGSTWFPCTDVQTVETMYLATTAKTMTEVEIHSLPEKRAKMVRTIYVWVRDSTFSRRVLKAYRYQCAITGLQLELPVAAHILPVASGVKNDKISNGISLSPTFHAAMDDGLIYLAYDIDDRLHLKRNGIRSGYLRHRKWDGRADMVLAYAESEISPKNMPDDRNEWPDKKMVDEGNRWRGILK